ncbi:hypothetical protein Vafri_21390 [Volvox africanus]|uniref:ethanolamine kinase n=1 Tax=Volvox africanus TaxID=51714 RepID=A0A8J4BTZ3_9CHLO|nr:hypothetical protein Vafri_21390 [Volvox africanus]
MMVPEDMACVVFSNGQEEAERQIKRICTRLLSGWADLGASDMQISRICGGISNLLVKVDPPAPLPAVAVKVFGDKTELLIDREAEKGLLLKLNAVGFGAPVVGLFNNGRIEKFLTAKTLTPEEMSHPRFVPHIARRLRAFHDLQIDDAAVDGGAAAAAAAAISTRTNIHPTTSNRDPHRNTAGTPSKSMAPPGGCSELVSEPPSQWDAIFNWLEMAQGLSFAHDPAKQLAYDKVDFCNMRTELKTLREMCKRVGSPRVLCHNDLLSGNILVVQLEPAADGQSTGGEGAGVGEGAGGHGSRCDGLGAGSLVEEEGGSAAGTTGAVQTLDEQVLSGGELQFIDFEYSCYGPRGFDWGNHFNEYAGFDCVYDR